MTWWFLSANYQNPGIIAAVLFVLAFSVKDVWNGIDALLRRTRTLEGGPNAPHCRPRFERESCSI
jgi:hypothetical protein